MPWPAGRRQRICNGKMPIFGSLSRAIILPPARDVKDAHIFSLGRKSVCYDVYGFQISYIQLKVLTMKFRLWVRVLLMVAILVPLYGTFRDTKTNMGDGSLHFSAEFRWCRVRPKHIAQAYPSLLRRGFPACRHWYR